MLVVERVGGSQQAMTLSETCSTRCKRAATEQPNLRHEGSVTATRMFRERFRGIEGRGMGRWVCREPGSFVAVFAYR